MHIRHGFCLALSLFALAGCVDPEGKFDEFQNDNPVIKADSGTFDAGTCTPPAAGEIDGTYLFTLAPITGGVASNYKNPIVCSADVTSSASGSDLSVKITLQPLDASDRSTPVGATIDVPAFTVAADGSFDLTTLGTINVEGAANPISGSPLVADITSMKGTFCHDDGFFCGDIAGEVTVPVVLNLEGSTFTYEKADGAPPYPDPPKLNCNKDLADPPK
jgi:hypothetical protein